MSYTKTIWLNGVAPAINDTNLNNMEQGIEDAHQGLADLAALDVLGGSVTLGGADGATITHNKGDTNYIIKLMPTGSDSPGNVGELSVVKAANTVVVYNSGTANMEADFEISAV